MSVLAVLAAVVASLPPPGATACSGCHPLTNNVASPVPSLMGRDAGSIVSQMQGFREGKLKATVMGRIAKGFSDEEMAAIAQYYQRLDGK